MAKKWAKPFYESKQWKFVRTNYIQSVHGLCERCLKRGVYKPGLIVHHKHYLTPENINNQNITLNTDNLEYLCQDCHNREHHGDAFVTNEDVLFDDEGNLIQR